MWRKWEINFRKILLRIIRGEKPHTHIKKTKRLAIASLFFFLVANTFYKLLADPGLFELLTHEIFRRLPFTFLAQFLNRPCIIGLVLILYPNNGITIRI